MNYLCKKNILCLIYLLIFISIVFSFLQIRLLTIKVRVLEHKLNIELNKEEYSPFVSREKDYLFNLFTPFISDNLLLELSSKGEISDTQAVTMEDNYDINSEYVINKITFRWGLDKYNICLLGIIRYQNKVDKDKNGKYPIDFCYPVIWENGYLLPDLLELQNLVK